jgi:hypothetical protein
MKPKFYELLQCCIEDGLERGLNRAYKHTDFPDSDRIRNCQFESIMLELHEWFDFEGKE